MQFRLFTVVVSLLSLSHLACTSALAQDFLSCRLIQESKTSADLIKSEILLKRLIQASPELTSNPNLQLIQDSRPNAFAKAPNLIFISSGLLEQVDGPEEIAFALAHELGHIVLGHRQSSGALSALVPSWQTLIAQEIEADNFASRRVIDVGFSANAGTKLLTTLQAHYESGAGGAMAAAQGLEARIRNLNSKNRTPALN